MRCRRPSGRCNARREEPLALTYNPSRHDGRRLHPPSSSPRVRRARGDQDARERADIVRRVIIREARPDEHAAVGELRVTAYRALGLLPAGNEYAEPLRALGFGGGDDVL